MRVTTFIGAGAAIEIEDPTTNGITQAVRKQTQTHFNQRTNFIDRIAKTLDTHYLEPSNFKEMFHTLELISSYKTGWKGAVKKYTPYMTAFASPDCLGFLKTTSC